jgi:hypothetical protein
MYLPHCWYNNNHYYYKQKHLQILWSGCRKAPVVISGDNVYIAWWSNKTGNNDEGMFRASADGGQTFDEKINLSNTTTDSVDAEIAAEGGKVIVTWWE